MKRKLILRMLTLTTALLLPLSGVLADSTDLTKYTLTDATVAAVNYTDLVAPCSGTLSTFGWENGDTVKAGEELVHLLTTDIIAPEDGTVAAVFAAEGDNAATAMSRYGMILAIEPAQQQQLKATTSSAFSKEENRTLHIGEQLYFRENSNNKTGTGIVTAISGKNYVVDIQDEEFDSDKLMTIYRSAACTERSKVGTGTVVRRDPIAVQAAGRIVELTVAAGDTVQAGQVVARVLSADAPEGTQPQLTAPADGVIAKTAVISGQQVWRGELLFRIWHTDELEIVASVDEMDLKDVRVGDSVPVTLDIAPEKIIYGTVTEISGAAVMHQNAACFTVHVSISDPAARIGAGASLYLPK